MARPRTVLVIVGPPAVGKMTVGRAVSERTGFPLFHNHIPIEAVLPVFPFGSPAFNRLVSDFRWAMLGEVAKSDLAGLIYTIMFDFGDPRELAFFDRLEGCFSAPTWRVVVVELEAELGARLYRNRTAERLEAKPSKRDVEASEARLLAAEEKYQLNSMGPVPFDAHLRIDSTALTPAHVAVRIIEHFRLG